MAPNGSVTRTRQGYWIDSPSGWSIVGVAVDEQRRARRGCVDGRLKCDSERRIRSGVAAALCDHRGVNTPDYLSWPDEHLSETVAAAYDDSVADRFRPEDVDPAVRVLAELALDGLAVEFAIGTGRLAVPLALAGVTVTGMDISEPMLAQLRMKPGAEQIQVCVGDMTSTRLCDDASLVYLVFNTIGNVRTQPAQVACFRNAAAHLRPGGCFVVENIVPNLFGLSAGETIRPFDVSPNHVGFDEFVDRVNQISISHHYFIDGSRVRRLAGAFRYVWPSELDLMAELAGLTLESRWANWHQAPFVDDSRSHVSIWRKG
jgi:SAM-dependent methyltransferase